MKNETSIRVVIPDETVNLCRKFSTEVASHQHATEFRNPNTPPRDIEEVAQDTFMGKLGEEAVARYIKHFHDISVDLDYEIYADKNIGDDQDIEVNGWRIEIKSTKITSRNLLVDKGNIKNKTNNKTLPDFYILCKVGRDKSVSGKPYTYVDIEGYITHERLITFPMIEAGYRIPNTDTRLQSSNYVVHEKDLCTAISSLFKNLQKYRR